MTPLLMIYFWVNDNALYIADFGDDQDFESLRESSTPLDTWGLMLWVLPFGYPILVYPDQHQKNYSASDKLSAPPPYWVRPRTSGASVQIRKATSPWSAR